MARFSIVNGKFIDPNGNLFIAGGLNLDSPNIANQVLSLLPGINFCRLPTSSFVDPSFWKPFIDVMTAKNVVCEIESHPWPLIGEPPPAGYAAWVAAMAAAYKDNPYVWGGSMNEPQFGDLTAEHVLFYQAWRGAGNQNPILFVGGIGGGNPGSTGVSVLNPNAYSKMTLVGFDEHFYGWVSNYSTNQSDVNNMLLGNAADTGVRSLHIQSADGPMPIIIGEFGPSTDGAATDPNAAQVIEAVTVWAVQQGLTSGYAAWTWDADPFNAVQQNGVLTSWGKTLAAAIAKTTSNAGAQPVASLDNTVIVAGSPLAIVDATGNVWAINSAGQVAVNGAADKTTSGVTQLAWVKGLIWQENGSKMWWSKSTPAAPWLPPAGVATSPIATPPVTQPPGPTMNAATCQSQVDAIVTALGALRKNIALLTP
jgi:mannan endo-1,4-beta-mannosidase